MNAGDEVLVRSTTTGAEWTGRLPGRFDYRNDGTIRAVFVESDTHASQWVPATWIHVRPK